MHKFANRMACVFHSGIWHIAERCSGDASFIWGVRPRSPALVRRFVGFHGAGSKIATMAANILVRDMRVPVSGWYSIDIWPDVHIRRTFARVGIGRDGASDEELIYAARELSPGHSGTFDPQLWETGRT